MQSLSRLIAKAQLSTWLTLGFLVAVLLVGWAVSADYGAAWDEPHQRTIGLRNYDFLVHHDVAALDFADKTYGPGYEMGLVAAEKGLSKVLGPLDSRQVWQLRRVINFSVFWLGAVGLWLIARRLWRSGWLSLIIVMWYVISPRIWGHAFFNTKDIPTMVGCVVATLALLWLMERQTVLRWVWWSVVVAVVVNLRPVGLLWPLAAAGVLFMQRAWLRVIPTLLSSLMLSLGLLGLSWPFLWQQPLAHGQEILARAASFPWNLSVLYLGQQWAAQDIPWHYLPVWLLISTPVVYSVLAMVGSGAILGNLRRSRISWYNQLPKLLILALFVVPLSLVIAADSTVYDDWRHLYFIYPFWLLLAGEGLFFLHRHISRWPGSRRWVARMILVLTIAGSVTGALKFMVLEHPYQQLYFNQPTHWLFPQLRTSFELDYWGTSYRAGLEYMADQVGTSEKPAKIMVVHEPGFTALGLLRPDQQQRLQLFWSAEIAQADYLMTTFRWHPEPYAYPVVYQQVVADTVVLAVYDLRAEGQ